MAVYRKNGSSWTSVKNIYRKVSSSWIQIKTVYRKVGSSWIKVFSGGGPAIAQQVTISQSTDPSTGLITLTGTNYRWSGASTLAYTFKRSRNNGVSWATIASGTATNPSVGSSNQYTYTLQNNLSDVYPDTDNMYVFEVTATSSANVVTVSESTAEYVAAVRDITNLSVTDTTYDSATLQFSGGAYASSFLVRYRVGTTDGYFNATASGSPSTITVTGLDSNTTYTFYVSGYTGGKVSGLVTGYAGNESSGVTGSTAPLPEPVKITSPSLSGTGEAFTDISASQGTYQSGSYTSITTKIVYFISPYTAPTDGETSSSATIMDTVTPVPTHTINQDDATTPNKKFYARDAVIAVNGTTTYYYYSPVKPAYVGTITDTFNRTVASGIGTSSSGYIYSAIVRQQNTSWSVNGSVAVNSTSLTPYTSFISPGSGAVEYPIQAIELTGKTNLTASIEIPSGGGGPGIAFWVSDAGSFWAVAPSYYKTSSTTTTTTCDNTTKTLADNATDTTNKCKGCPVSTVNITNPSSDCNGVSKSTDSSGTGCYGCSVTTNPGYTVRNCGSGTTYNYGNAIVAQAACGSCGYTDTSYTNKTCTGGPANYPNNTLGTGCGDKCSCTGPFTSTTYGCTGSGSGGSCPTTTTTTYNASTVGTRCGPCSQPIAGVNFFTYPVVAATNTTYYTCYTNVCTNVQQFSCTYSETTYPTTYTCTGRDTSTTSTEYRCYPKDNSVTTYTYKTQLRIMSTAYGYYVGVLKDQNINSNNSAFQKAFKISVTTSGDDITATAYSDLSGTVIGTASYTRGSSDLAKSAANGASYAGVIKTPSAIYSGSLDDNAGSTYNNLYIA